MFQLHPIRTLTRVSLLGAALLLAAPAGAADKSAEEIFTEGCKAELELHCKGVTPGEGRLVACIYARNDHLTARCEFALYDAASQLQRELATLSYVASECAEDVRTVCAGVRAGEGRLLQCAKDREKELSKRCKQALKSTGLKK